MKLADYPHEGSCPVCLSFGLCNVCGKPAPRAIDRCTNGRCDRCHAATCTPGGSITPGHGYGVRRREALGVAVNAAVAQAACAGWISGDAYYAEKGRYRLKSTGRFAPWSREAMVIFRGCDELHFVAHMPEAQRQIWIEWRTTGCDTVRISPYELRKARETIERHTAPIKLALQAAGLDTDALRVVQCALAALDTGWRPAVPFAEVDSFIEDRLVP